jgi:hypothetical protein
MNFKHEHDVCQPVVLCPLIIDLLFISGLLFALQRQPVSSMSFPWRDFAKDFFPWDAFFDDRIGKRFCFRFWLLEKNRCVHVDAVHVDAVHI